MPGTSTVFLVKPSDKKDGDGKQVLEAQQVFVTPGATRGVAILGDAPIFVAFDSADVWAHRELFALDKTGHPSAVVMLTAVNDDETILESIQAGADGYLTKDRAVEDVVSAVRQAHAGETLLPRSVIVGIAQRVVAARDRGTERIQIEPLTPREPEVLKALTEGLSTPEICERLFIAPNTLRTHVQNIMGKLRVHSKLEAVAFAIRNRLVEPPRPEGSLY